MIARIARYGLTGAALTLPAVAAGQARQPDRCEHARTAHYHVGRPATPHRLADEPPAARLYALYRTVDRCPQPVVLQEGIGANPERRRRLPAAPPAPRHVR